MVGKLWTGQGDWGVRHRTTGVTGQRRMTTLFDITSHYKPLQAITLIKRKVNFVGTLMARLAWYTKAVQHDEQKAARENPQNLILAYKQAEVKISTKASNYEEKSLFKIPKVSDV